MFEHNQEELDHQQLMQLLNEMDIAEPPCWSYPDAFFPDEVGGGTELHIAKRLCADCPIKIQCASYAIKWEIEHGIWGGTSANERRQIRRMHKVAERHA